MPRTLLIVSTAPHGRVAARIQDVATAAGFHADVCGLDQARFLTEQSLADTIILPRIAPEYNTTALPILIELERKGAQLINSAMSWDTSRDKWKTYLTFQNHSVPTPNSRLYPETSYSQCRDLLGNPFLLKPLDGTHGEGIIIVHYEADLHGKKGIAQQYVQAAAGKDIRVIVVGNRVIAAMERTARSGDFRANLHQGATASDVTIDAKTKEIAVRGARSLGLDIAGVDIIMSPNGPMVLEANPSPGLRIERYAGDIVVPAMIDWISRLD